MTEQVTEVTVSVHKASSNPILPIIQVVEVIKGGKGTLTEEIFGGRVTLQLKLTEGEAEHQKLAKGDLVYVRGTRGTDTVLIANAMTTDAPSKPWTFTRVSGSTG